VLRAETERMLADPKSHRFVEASRLRIESPEMEDSTPSTTLYNDYYLDDASPSRLAETQLYFTEMGKRDLPARMIVNSDFTFSTTPRAPLRASPA